MSRLLHFPQRWCLTGASLIASLVLLYALAVPPDPAHAAGDLPSQWETDWKSALAHAAERKQPLIAMFSAVWCPPCKTMKKEVLTQPAIQQKLNAWTAVYIDEASNRELLEKFKIEGFPTFVFLNSAGEEFGRQSGGMSADDFGSVLERQQKLITHSGALQARIKQEPKNPAAYKAYGDLLAEGGKYEDAAKIYQTGAQHDPQNKTGIQADARYAAALLIATTNPAEAQTRFEAIEKDYPKSPRAGDSLFIRALMAVDHSEKATARTLLEQYLKRYPQGRFIAQCQTYLKQLKP
jgi:thioredoxin-related protein